jgi:MFS family permease
MVITQPVLSWLGDPSRDLLISVAAVFAALLGVCNAFVLIPAQTMLQERSHEHVRARVYATFFTISNVLAFVPIMFAAVLADLLGVINVLAIVSILIATLGLQSVVRRRVEEDAMWRRSRRLVRDGPESISPGSGRKRFPL